MSDIVVKELLEMDCYAGPHAIEGIRFLQAASSLGVSAWGMNLLEISPGSANHPKHDHKADGQEEVYLVLRGAVLLVTDDSKTELGVHAFARVPAAVERQLIAQSEGALVLAIGGTPNQPYKPQ